MLNSALEPGLRAYLNGAATVIVAGAVILALWGVAFALGHLAAPFRWFREHFDRSAKRVTFITGTRYSPRRRWTTFLVWVTASSSAAAFGPPYMVIGVLILGLLFVAFIVRHWTWDTEEKDREITVGTKVKTGSLEVPVKHIDIDVDLTTETIASFLYLFLLAGTAFSRLDECCNLLHESVVWPLFQEVRAALYVIAEIPEASPIFDTTSIFRSGNLTGVHYDSALLRGATLGLRIVYELLLVVAVLRVLEFGRRTIARSDIGEIAVNLRAIDAAERERAIIRAGRQGLAGQENAIKLLTEVVSARLEPDGEFLHAIKQRFDASSTLVAVGIERDRAGALISGIEGFRQVLKEWTRDTAPIDWAKTQSNLGASLIALGGIEGSTERLEQASIACRAALEVFTRERWTSEWARAQNNLAAALGILGMCQPTTDYLRKAIEIRREVLMAYSRERSLLNWVKAQNDLGRELRTVGQIEPGTARLEEAVAAHRVALKELTRKRNPLDWR